MAINLECPLLQGEVSPWGLPSTSTRTVIKAAVYMFFFVRRISRLHVHVSGIPYVSYHSRSIYTFSSYNHPVVVTHHHCKQLSRYYGLCDAPMVVLSHLVHARCAMWLSASSALAHVHWPLLL
jgi:hypothetical protein